MQFLDHEQIMIVRINRYLSIERIMLQSATIQALRRDCKASISLNQSAESVSMPLQSTILNA